MRRTTVQSQPKKIVHETLSRKKPITKNGWCCGSRCSSSPSTTKKKKVVGEGPSDGILVRAGLLGRASCSWRG
jgi:hypothetical protein